MFKLRNNDLWTVDQKYLGIIHLVHAKCSEKLTFLTPWYAHVRVRNRGEERLVFRKILLTYQMNDSIDLTISDQSFLSMHPENRSMETKWINIIIFIDTALDVLPLALSKFSNSYWSMRTRGCFSIIASFSVVGSVDVLLNLVTNLKQPWNII